MDLIGKSKFKDLTDTVSKIFSLVKAQSAEIDLLQIRVALLQGNPSKAKDILNISKSIPEDFKLKLLKEEIEVNNAKEEEIKEGNAHEGQDANG